MKNYIADIITLFRVFTAVILILLKPGSAGFSVFSGQF